MFDVIGDIHGHYTELHQLFLKMGYSYDEDRNIFSHSEGRQAIFIGDFIDRGFQNLKVISLVRNMIETGNAQAIMGNHELNAIQLTTPDLKNPGEYIRKRTKKNLKQSGTFLEEVVLDSNQHQEIIEWFKTLPICLSIDNLNFAHACWYPEGIEKLKKVGMITESGCLTEEGWEAAHDEDSFYYKFIDTLLKGPEEELGSDISFLDIHGIKRTDGRVAWWNENPQTYEQAFTGLPLDVSFREAAYKPKLPNALSESIRKGLNEMNSEEFIFIGHIWCTGNPRPLSDRIACVDYSVAKEDKLAAYRWNQGDKNLMAQNFVWVPSVDSPQVKATPKIVYS